MPPLLPRFFAALERIEDDRRIAKAILEGEDVELPTRVAAGATAAGDPRRLRGIPAIGRGCSGAIPGTRPGDSLMRENGRRS